MSAESQCLFCRMIRREIPTTIVHEDEATFAFRDIRPVAPVHILVVPKKHLASVAEAQDEDISILGKVLGTAKTVAKANGLDEGGYRLVINHGPDAGQSVFHLHLHVLGGRGLSWPPG